MNIRVKAASLLVGATALALALAPAAHAQGIEVEVAGVQTGPNGGVQYVCSFSGNGLEQACVFPAAPVAAQASGQGEVAGVRVAPSVTTEVAGVQAGPNGAVYTCTFFNSGVEQSCAIGR